MKYCKAAIQIRQEHSTRNRKLVNKCYENYVKREWLCNHMTTCDLDFPYVNQDDEKKG